MVQDFSLRYPLVDGQGNFASVDGDPPAAYRYTEARLTRIAMTMLEDIDKNTVDFVPNFDDRLQEPTRSEEHTSELQSQSNLVCRLLLEKKKTKHLPTDFWNRCLYIPLTPINSHTVSSHVQSGHINGSMLIALSYLRFALLHAPRHLNH